MRLKIRAGLGSRREGGAGGREVGVCADRRTDREMYGLYIETDNTIDR